MKLVNVLVNYDLWIVVSDDEDPSTVALQLVQNGDMPPSEVVRYPIKHERDIPVHVRREKPWVSSTVTEEEYKPFEGSTVEEIYGHLYTKRPAS